MLNPPHKSFETALIPYSHLSTDPNGHPIPIMLCNSTALDSGQHLPHRPHSMDCLISLQHNLFFEGPTRPYTARATMAVGGSFEVEYCGHISEIRLG